MTIGPFGARLSGDTGQVGRIKGWVTRVFGLDVETPVMVMELRCAEPGCPPVETAVAILDVPGSPRQYEIHGPMSEVTLEDVGRLAVYKGEGYQTAR